jgi:hypothetical protein
MKKAAGLIFPKCVAQIQREARNNANLITTTTAARRSVTPI